jgi:hypothetical protein
VNRTKKQIKEELDKVVKEKMTLSNPLSDPKVKALAAKLEEKKRDYLKRTLTKRQELHDRELRLQMEYASRKRANPYPPIPEEELPDDIEKWWRGRRGFEGGMDWSILWISSDKSHVITKQPGGNYWSGRGETSHGCTLFELQKVGNSLLDSVFKHEGRMNKKVFEEMKQIGEEQSK